VEKPEAAVDAEGNLIYDHASIVANPGVRNSDGTHVDEFALSRELALGVATIGSHVALLCTTL
jgi:hypothetical protein